GGCSAEISQRRRQEGKRGNGTGDGASQIGNNQRIVACVSRLRVCDAKIVAGGPCQIRSIEPPLIKQPSAAFISDQGYEGGGLAGQDRLVSRLLRNFGRSNDSQAGRTARYTAISVCDHHIITSCCCARWITASVRAA